MFVKDKFEPENVYLHPKPFKEALEIFCGNTILTTRQSESGQFPILDPSAYSDLSPNSDLLYSVK
jgi:hypothetical protein